jgi:hypothetical protein
MTSDLFQDGGVVKSVIRSSNESGRPKRGDEVALTYTLLSGDDNHTKNVIHTVGTSTADLFLPLRTLDRIICDMKRNEKCKVKVTPEYSGSAQDVEYEITLLHIRAVGGDQSNGGIHSLGGELGDFQSHLMRNPDVMEQMMASPFMQSLLSNPETLRSIMGTNPQMQELLRRNPELNNMMNDPEFLQQTAEAMRNPAVMREMMRNNDRAMSNIESLPGGSAALHKLYNEIQAPLFEASQAPSGQVKKLTDRKDLRAKYGEAAKPSKPVSEPMINPWARGTSKVPAPIVPQSRTGPVDLSAMSRMMQDQSFQEVLASSMRSQPTHNRSNESAMLQQMFNPDALRAVGRLEQSLQPGPGSFSSLFGNFLSTNQVNLEERFREQLSTLREMGFTDTQAALRALQECNGDVDEAAVKLASQLEESGSPSTKK